MWLSQARWMVDFIGKSHLEMDDDLGVPLFSETFKHRNNLSFEDTQFLSFTTWRPQVAPEFIQIKSEIPFYFYDPIILTRLSWQNSIEQLNNWTIAHHQFRWDIHEKSSVNQHFTQFLNLSTSGPIWVPLIHRPLWAILGPLRTSTFHHSPPLRNASGTSLWSNPLGPAIANSSGTGRNSSGSPKKGEVVKNEWDHGFPIEWYIYI